MFCQCQDIERQANYVLSTDCGNDVKYLNFIPVTYDWTIESPGVFEFTEMKDVLRGIAKLNEQLNKHNIYVHLPEVHEEVSTVGVSSLNVIPTIINNLNLEKAIIGGFRSQGSYQGWGYSIPNNYFHVSGFDASVSEDQLGLVSHELGHNLGLFHTFFAPDEASEIMELPDSSNCAIAGDYICDTPADHLSLLDSVSSETCIFSPPGMWHAQIIDPPLNPDISNLMSYYPYECRNKFTDEQGLAMHCVLANSTDYMDGQIVTSNRQAIHVNTTETYDDPKDIFADIIIEDGGILNINAKVRMPFFGKIIVEPGGRLFINDGGHVTSYTQGQYWQDITAIGVESGNNFPRVILNHGTIENARVAVNGMNRILLLANNQFTFLNNKTGIKLSSHQGTNLSSIKNCIFKTDNDLFDVAWDVPLMDGTLDTIRGQSNQYAGHR